MSTTQTQTTQAIKTGDHVSVKSEMRKPRGQFYSLPVRIGEVYLVVGSVAYVTWDGGVGSKSTRVAVSSLVRRDDWREARAAVAAAAVAHATALIA